MNESNRLCDGWVRDINLDEINDRELGPGDIETVVSELSGVAYKWFETGSVLGIDSNLLMSAPNHVDGLRQVITLFIGKQYNKKRVGPPTWRPIVAAVSHPQGGNNHTLARLIANSHRGIESLLEREGLTSRDVDQECKGDHIWKFYFRLANWEQVLLHLGLKPADIEMIKRDASDVHPRRFKALMMWKSNNVTTGTATYRQLLNAMLECGNPDTARKVCRLLKAPPPQPGPVTGPDFEQSLMEANWLTSSDVDQECSDDHLQEVSPELEHWEYVAQCLGLLDADIDPIKNDGQSISLKRYHVLKKWKSNNLPTGTATYRLLIRAIFHGGTFESAMRVCGLLKEAPCEDLKLFGQQMGLTIAEVDQVCSNEHIQEIGPKLEQWEQVASRLRLTTADIGKIKKNASRSYGLSALQRWQSAGLLDGTATYRVLLNALFQSGHTGLALKVCRLLKESGDYTVPPTEQTDNQAQTEEDKDWKPQFDDAMEAGRVEVNTIPVLLMGPAGSGKTTLKKLLCDQNSEDDKRTSTMCLDGTVVVLPVNADKPTSASFKDGEGIVRPIKTVCFQTKSDGTSDSKVSKWELVDSNDLITMLAQEICTTKKPSQNDNDDTKPSLNITEAPSDSHHDIDGAHETPKSTPVDLVLVDNTAATNPTSHGDNKDTAANSDVRQAIDSVVNRVESVLGDVDIESKDNKFTTLTIRLTDTGGQRQFHDIAPLFTQQASVGLFVSRLIDDLDGYPSDEFYVKGVCVGRSSTSHLSHKETLQSLLRAFTSRSVQKQNYIFIGTHRDKVEEQIASNQSKFKSIHEFLDSKNEQLLKMIPQDLKKNIFSRDLKLKHVIVDIDAKNIQDPGTQCTAQKIRARVENSVPLKVPVPLRWFVLELSLQELCSKLGRGVLTKDECSSIVEGIGGFNDPSMLDAALKYFNKVYIVHYYPDILPNLVFVDPQIPLDILSMLTKRAIELRNAEKLKQPQLDLPTEMKWKDFKEKGIFTRSMLQELVKKKNRTSAGGIKHFHGEIFSPEDMIEIMKKKLLIAATLEEETTDSETEFFMPSLLTSLPPSELEKHIKTDSGADTLIIQCEDGCIKHGAFCCLVVFLMKDRLWKWSSPPVVMRNCISFKYPKHPGTVTLIDSYPSIKVHYNADINTCKKVCPKIKQDVQDGIKDAYENLHYNKPDLKYCVNCPHTQSTSKPDSHLAEITTESDHWCCCVDNNHHHTLQPGHCVWLNKPFEMSSKFTTLIQGWSVIGVMVALMMGLIAILLGTLLTGYNYSPGVSSPSSIIHRPVLEDSCHPITTQADKKLAHRFLNEVGDWFSLCLSLDVAESIREGLQFEEITVAQKITRCVDAYLKDTVKCCFEKVIDVMCELHLSNSASSLAIETGVNYERLDNCKP